MIRRIAIYYRVSTSDQRPDAQVHELRDYAKKRRFEIVGEYVDTASGAAKSRPELDRPYRSPLGIPGAVVGLLLSLVALVSTFLDKDAQAGVTGVAIFLLVGIIYFLAYSRHHLVAQAPEEEVALLTREQDKLSG